MALWSVQEARQPGERRFGEIEIIDKGNADIVVARVHAVAATAAEIGARDETQAGFLPGAERETLATAERADLFLQIRPGTDLVLLNGLLHLLGHDHAEPAEKKVMFDLNDQIISAWTASRA